MVKRRKRRKPPSLRSRIVNLIMERGPVKLGVMVEALESPYQSVNTKALELRRLGVLKKDDDGIWSLVPGVNLEAVGIKVASSNRKGAATGSSASSVLVQAEGELTLEEDFNRVLRNTGLGEVALLFTEIFFAGDISDMAWLYHILSDIGRDYINEGQCRLMMGYWATKYGIPYRGDDFFD